MASVGDFHECCGNTTLLECRHVVPREHRLGVGVFAARQCDNLDIKALHLNLESMGIPKGIDL